MIIDVNPQTITGIAQTIANAYGEVEEAARILTSITEHNNWNCKERDAINDYTRSNVHWLTACSLAPAQVIISINIQKILDVHNSLRESPCSPSS